MFLEMLSLDNHKASYLKGNKHHINVLITTIPIYRVLENDKNSDVELKFVRSILLVEFLFNLLKVKADSSSYEAGPNRF